jgi:predicted O-linked N-acetylglucosamine transferase (SPINDLY family)
MSKKMRVAAPSPPDASGASGAWAEIKRQPNQPAVWLRLAQHYAQQGLPWQAGYAARQTQRLNPQALPQLQALAIPQWQDMQAGDALLGRANLAEASALAERFAQVGATAPGDWLTHLYLARLMEMTGRNSVTTINQACALEPLAGETLHWMGVWRLNAGDAPGAVAAFSGLLDIRPVRTGSMMYLGEALLRTGQTEAAEKAFARASLSNSADFLVDLAGRVYAHNYWQEALQVLGKALAVRPDHVPTLLALAKMQSEVYDLADCERTLSHIARLDVDNADARLLRAGLQGRMGDARGHLQTLQTAYAQGGDPLSRLASSIAMTALYHDTLTPLEVADLHRSLCAPITQAVQQKTDFANPLTTKRRLRLGLVTGDLHRQHPVNIFMLPILQRFNPDKLELCIYHTGTMHDAYTAQAKACSQRWLEAAKLDDNTLQAAIVADGVDVLIDLAGHTATHRLGVFALRAAPVQATFLGYPHSTGLATIDWLIGDATVSPVGHAALFSEGIAQLPGSVFCWHDEGSYPLPAARSMDAPVVFGSFNNAMKLSPRTIALWARVLLAVPDSRLLLKAPSLRDAAVCERFATLFAEHGVSRERLEFRGPTGLADMMQEYGDMDIALDPTPYNGGTTTLQALWMGVPVVALQGGNFVSRMGASFLRTLGRGDWVAQDEAAYVRIAVALAQGCANQRGQRSALRGHMAASGLCDIDRYTQNFEALVQAMWAQHGTGEPSRLIALQP